MNSLIDVMKILRSPRGCPWDKKQTFESLMSCLLEETHEVIDAVVDGKFNKLEEELGDLLCIVSMLIVIAEEEHLFAKRDVITGAVRKMKHRHPHVFSSKSARDSDSAHTLWHEAKEKEKSVQARKSVLDDLSVHFPALHRADKIQRRVARVNFDWSTIDEVFEKVHEEIDELKKEIKKRKRNEQRIQEELGDVLFSVVNIGRTLKVNAEIALHKTNNKFVSRFKAMEKEIKRQGLNIREMTLAELDTFWENAKRKMRKTRK